MLADLSPGTIWSRALEQSEAVGADGPLSDDPSMSGAVVPMRIRETVVGLVAVERRGQPWTAQELARFNRTVDETPFGLMQPCSSTKCGRWLPPRNANDWHGKSTTGSHRRVASLGYLVDDIRVHASPDVEPHLADCEKSSAGS